MQDINETFERSGTEQHGSDSDIAHKNTQLCVRLKCDGLTNVAFYVLYRVAISENVCKRRK